MADARRRPFSNAASLHEYVLTTIFLADLVLKFRLAFRSQEQLIGDPAQIRKRYFKCASCDSACACRRSGGRLGSPFRAFKGRCLRPVSSGRGRPQFGAAAVGCSVDERAACDMGVLHRLCTPPAGDIFG